MRPLFTKPGEKTGLVGMVPGTSPSSKETLCSSLQDAVAQTIQKVLFVNYPVNSGDERAGQLVTIQVR